MVYAKVLVLLAVVLFGTDASTPIVEEETPTVQEICSLMPRGATILRPNSCTNWIRCPSTADSNDFEEGACVFGLYYNKDINRCEYQNDVKCPYSQEPTNRCAKQEDGVFLTDVDNCNGYIFCKSGREMRSSCPNGLVFHPQKSACVYNAEYECPEKVDAVASTPICRSISNNVTFANEDDCTQYHTCINGVLTTLDCGNENAFDHVLGKCVERENVVCLATAKAPKPESKFCGTNRNNTRVGYFADEISCSGYYICTALEDGSPDRDPQHVQCNAGYFYDAEKWSCRDRLNVKCTLDRCEGMGNKYVNIAGDCTAYARCNNGISVDMGNCPSGYYFDERTQGCTPNNVSYAACLA